MKIRLAAACLFIFSALGVCQELRDASLETPRAQAAQNPRSSLIHYRIGEILYKRSQLSAATAEFQAALNGDLLPKWVEAVSHIYLAKILEDVGEAETAKVEYRRAAEVKRGLISADELPLPSGAYRAGGDVSAPVLVEQTRTEYSDEGRVAGLEGSVVLVGIVGEDGRPRDLRVTSPLGVGLDEKALEEVKLWKYEPGMLQGKPVAIFTTFRVEFELSERRSRWHLIRANFDLPDGVQRPYFRKAPYPSGPGISRSAMDHASVISAIDRQAAVTITFQVDTQGYPRDFHVLNSTDEIWNREAVELVTDWRFIPATKDGKAVEVPCTLRLVWGKREIDWSRIPASDESELWQRAVRPSVNPGGMILQRRKEPGYSPEALQARVEGVVLLYAMVDGDGVPRDLRVIKPLGYGLDEKALEAAAEWRFQRPTVNERGSPTPLSFEVVFRLPETPAATPAKP